MDYLVEKLPSLRTVIELGVVAVDLVLEITSLRIVQVPFISWADLLRRLL